MSYGSCVLQKKTRAYKISITECRWTSLKITRKSARSPETRNISFLGIAIRGFEYDKQRQYIRQREETWIHCAVLAVLFYNNHKKKTVLQARSPRPATPEVKKRVNFPTPPTNRGGRPPQSWGLKQSCWCISRREAKAPSITQPRSTPTYYNLPQTKRPATPRTTQGTAAGW
jgi:hypothetical protein